MIVLPYKFRLRHYQKELFEAIFKKKIKRCVCVWHRRAGKSKCAINVLVSAALLKVGVYFHMFPELTQAKKVIWRGIDSDGMRYLDHIPKEIVKRINNQEMSVELYNGSIIQLASADRYNSVMGSGPAGIVFDEYSICNPLSWHYLRPILAHNNGWAIFIYTPRGHNHGYDLYYNNIGNNDWLLQRYDALSTLNSDGSPVLTKEIIQQERDSGMPEELVNQEFFCSFESALVGAYYSKEIQKARDENRISNFQISPTLPLFSFWDLGVSDAMAIWIMQPEGSICRMVGYYENQGEGIHHYIEVLRAFSKKYGARFMKHFAPHDATHRDWVTNRTRIEQAREAGMPFTLVKKLSIADGIQAARLMFGSTYFHEENCKYGVRMLSEYTKKYSNDKKAYEDHPHHNYASNGADAFRYYAVAWSESMQNPQYKKAIPISEWNPLSV